MRPTEKDVLTPIAASVLFGRSNEAVRRATSEGVVKTACVLEFSAKRRVRLIDLESAKSYWLRGERRSYRDSFEAEVQRMRGYGITFGRSAATTQFRILHPFPLMVPGSLVKDPDGTEV